MKFFVVAGFAVQALAGYFMLKKDGEKAGIALVVSGILLLSVQIAGML